MTQVERDHPSGAPPSGLTGREAVPLIFGANPKQADVPAVGVDFGRYAQIAVIPRSREGPGQLTPPRKIRIAERAV